MQEYKNRAELIAEIEKAAELFIAEFDGIEEKDKDKMLEGIDRSPMQMIAYQLGWMYLVLQWDTDEREGKKVITPSPDYKWNKLGGLYDSFYAQHAAYSLHELMELFKKTVAEMLEWINTLSEDELFKQDARRWASSTPSRWPVWKWIHINTVAPFKTFRSKIRKWKKLNTAQ